MKPSDFPIGSLESRAAARSQLAHKNDGRKRLRLISHIPRPDWDNSRYHFGEWEDWGEDTLCEMVYVPHVWVKPGEAIPRCPDCGTPFKKTDEYPYLLGYEANCMDKHDPELIGQMARQGTNLRTVP
jgi:hypothetical protein